MHKLPIILAGILTLFLSGCGRPESRVESGIRTGVLHYGNGVEPQDLDPHTNTGSPESRIISALFEGLVNRDDTGDGILPGVADSWEVSDDALTYTFHLRNDARWSDGVTIDAHTFVASFRRLITPELAAEYAYFTHPVVGAEAFHRGQTDEFSTVGFRALDTETVEIELREPLPQFLSQIAEYPWMPVPLHVIEAHGGLTQKGSRWTRPGNLVSNGAFRLKEWIPNKVVVAEKNPEYWDAASVGLNEIHFHPIESQETAERAFRAGQLHATSSLPVSKIAVYKQDHPEALRLAPRLGVAYVMVNTTRPPFDQPEIRRAFALAINRELLVDKVLQAGQRPAFTFSQPGMGGFTSTEVLTGTRSDIPELLDQGGYPGGAGFPEIDYLYNTSEGNRAIAVTLQEMWRHAIGAEVKLVNQEWKVFLDNRTMGEYSLGRAGWMPFVDDPIDYFQLITAASPDNSTGWSDPEFEDCFRRARATIDREERNRFYQCMESIVLRDLPVIPIYHSSTVYLVHPSVRGWTMNRLDTRPWKQIRLEED